MYGKYYFPDCIPSKNIAAGDIIPNKNLLPASVCTDANMVTAGKLVGAGQAYIDMGLYKNNTKAPTAQTVARDIVARIDGLYSEHYQSLTDTYALDASTLFTEFYFDVNDQHKITLGLRYTKIPRKLK